MRVEKIDVFPELSDRRKGTRRGGSTSITFGAAMLRKAGLANLTDFEILPVDGGGLFIRAPGATAPMAQGSAPADWEVESQGGDGNGGDEGLF